MSIHLHIDRLILDGVNIAPGQQHLLQAAVESRLADLLQNGGLHQALHSGGTLNVARPASIHIANDGNASHLGDQIAGAVYGGIGK